MFSNSLQKGCSINFLISQWLALLGVSVPPCGCRIIFQQLCIKCCHYMSGQSNANLNVLIILFCINILTLKLTCPPRPEFHMLLVENNTHNYPVKFETSMQGAELKVFSHMHNRWIVLTTQTVSWHQIITSHNDCCCVRETTVFMQLTDSLNHLNPAFQKAIRYWW